MTRSTPIDRIRNAKGGTAAADAVGGFGRHVGGAYDQAAAAALQAYDEAQAAYRDALSTAEQSYEEARTAAEDAYAAAQSRAGALLEQGARLYDDAVRRSRAYGDRAARFTGDNKALALLLAGGVGFLLAVALKRK